MREIWKALIYQNENYGIYYEVSNFGSIRNTKTKKIKKIFLNRGYCQTAGSLGSRNKKITFKVHKAVAETFIENPDKFPQVNHKDGNKQNNRSDNLEWCDNTYNAKHAIKYGLRKINPFEEYQKNNRKFDAEEIKYIRNNYIPRDKKYGIRALSRRFGVHHKTISDIVLKKIYVNI